MAFMDDLKKFGKSVAQKSSDVVETTKLNMSISQEKEKINKLFIEIGAAVYEQYKLGNDLGLSDKCNQVAELEAKIEEYQSKILEIKNAMKCPGCGTEINADTTFCPQCGTKVK